MKKTHIRWGVYKMENLPTISPIFWVITTIITTLSSVVLGTITWIKSAKLMPKELNKAELENKITEVSLAESYEKMANNAAEKAVGMQARLNKNEEDISELKKEIRGQNNIIQELKFTIGNQEKEITGLVQDLSLSRAYTFALIQQMKLANLVPIELSSINVEEYRREDIGNIEKPKRAYKRKPKQEENTEEDNQE